MKKVVYHFITIPVEYSKLCPSGPGRGESGMDINECKVLPGVCKHGYCINTDGSFRCICPTGYKLEAIGRLCVGKAHNLLLRN